MPGAVTLIEAWSSAVVINPPGDAVHLKVNPVKSKSVEDDDYDDGVPERVARNMVAGLKDIKNGAKNFTDAYFLF